MSPNAPIDDAGAENSPLIIANGVYGSVEPKLLPVKDSSSEAEKSQRRLEQRVLVKTQSSFWEDTVYFNDGSIPHSIVLAVVIGVVCGVACFVYYTFLFWAMEFVWHTLPQLIIVDNWPEWAYVFWIPLVGSLMAVGVGLTVVYMGEPGDLPYTIKCVHDQAYVAMDHVMPMVNHKKCALSPITKIIFLTSLLFI
jgi:hypothetical protein